MNAGTTIDRPYQPLLDWFAAQNVEYEIHPHDLAFTARATATAEGVDPRTFAKVVVVVSHDGPTALVVLDATDHLDLRKARHLLDAGEVRLLSEPELRALAPGCDVGAIPAVGALFGLRTYADRDVRDDSEISFNAGSHRVSARVERASWERACSVIYGDLAEDTDAGPVWARS
ncbi:MAG TPA: YbaK/EbsC family protein [Candidatus Limnocylindrales bacterium]|nr:YbaK/EbsC family protein [Candidatus Limnocylindrales bacterium]